MDWELPAGSICCVLGSVIIDRIELETCRTSVFGRLTTVVIRVAGWSLYSPRRSGST